MPTGSVHGAQAVSSPVPSRRHQGQPCTQSSAGKLGSWTHSQCGGPTACPAGVPVVAAHRGLAWVVDLPLVAEA